MTMIYYCHASLMMPTKINAILSVLSKGHLFTHQKTNSRIYKASVYPCCFFITLDWPLQVRGYFPSFFNHWLGASCLFLEKRQFDCICQVLFYKTFIQILQNLHTKLLLWIYKKGLTLSAISDVCKNSMRYQFSRKVIVYHINQQIP